MPRSARGMSLYALLNWLLTFTRVVLLRASRRLALRNASAYSPRNKANGATSHPRGRAAAPCCYRRSQALMATEKRIPPRIVRQPTAASPHRRRSVHFGTVVSRGSRRHLDRLPPAPGFWVRLCVARPRGPPASTLIWNAVSRLCCLLIYPVPPTSRGAPASGRPLCAKLGCQPDGVWKSGCKLLANNGICRCSRLTSLFFSCFRCRR